MVWYRLHVEFEAKKDLMKKDVWDLLKPWTPLMEGEVGNVGIDARKNRWKSLYFGLYGLYVVRVEVGGKKAEVDLIGTDRNHLKVKAERMKDRYGKSEVKFSYDTSKVTSEVRGRKKLWVFAEFKLWKTPTTWRGVKRFMRKYRKRLQKKSR